MTIIIVTTTDNDNFNQCFTDFFITVIILGLDLQP